MLFTPGTPLNGFPWFPKFRMDLGNFGLGVHRTAHAEAIATLKKIAVDAGWGNAT